MHLVYNGELYNVRALRAELLSRGVRSETTGVTEVVLKALVEWGPVAFERFSGAFALALWDERLRELTVARDRYGIKPLYWRELASGGASRHAIRAWALIVLAVWLARRPAERRLEARRAPLLYRSTSV